jgi:hypothetical protein
MGLGLVEINDQEFCSLLDMYMFRNGASSSTGEGSISLCRRYFCCTVVTEFRLSGKLLLAVASTVILASESRGTHGHCYSEIWSTIPLASPTERLGETV